MVVRRDSLRAQTDFFSPMTGNKGTNIRYADAPRRKDTYGSEVKSRLADIKNVRGTRVNPIEAVFTKLIKTEDPFTQIDRKKSYAPEEEQDGLQEALGGAADTAEQVVGDAVGQVKEVVRSTGQRASERRAAQQLKRQQEREADLKAAESARQNIRTDFQNRVKGVSDEVKTQGDRFKSFSIAQIKRDIDQDIAQRKTAQDAKTYEQNRLKQRELTQSRLKGVETGLSNLGSNYKAQEQAAIDNMNKFREGLKKDVDDKISEVKKMYGQGGLPLGTTAPRQVVSGMTTGVKDGVKVEAKPKVAINASTFQQKNVRGSGIPGKSGKDESARPKQVSNLPSNYKATEAEAFRVAKAYKEAKAIAERNPNVSVTVDSKGKPVAKAEQKTRSEAGTAARTAQGNAARVQNNARARAQAAAVNRKLSGKSISQTKAANKASMKAAAAARHASFKSQKAAGTHARTASAQRARNKAAAKARAKAAAKKRRSKKSGGGCPDPMMLILMANGSQKRAGDLKVGDLIKTNHEKDMKLGEYKVEYVNVLNNREKAKFTFEESEIVCSLTHKFYVDNDWKEAEDMVIGDIVSGQKLISIDDVEDGDVIHITVEDAHTYICEGLLSHNKRCDIRTKENIEELTSMNLLRDDLADVAYFVRELREVEL